jgi:hypothetical protein
MISLPFPLEVKYTFPTHVESVNKKVTDIRVVLIMLLKARSIFSPFSAHSAPPLITMPHVNSACDIAFVAR